MRYSRLQIVLKELQRFKKRVENADWIIDRTNDRIPMGADAAAVKRASLDLTRALANLRKPDFR